MATDNPQNPTKEITKQRYNESTVTKAFLNSPAGIPFLVASTNAFSDSEEQRRNIGLEEKIENLIDFYTTWTNSFPVRKNLKLTKYEYLKHVEAFCSKSEISESFVSMLGL